MDEKFLNASSKYQSELKKYESQVISLTEKITTAEKQIQDLVEARQSDRRSFASEKEGLIQTAKKEQADSEKEFQKEIKRFSHELEKEKAKRTVIVSDTLLIVGNSNGR